MKTLVAKASLNFQLYLNKGGKRALLFLIQFTFLFLHIDFQL
ncbi:hypothetical protein C7972_101445 [Arenibacter sp. ARW7G5Y1]|nr:hypothetical protein C7972_101445 [Arenibacter sp. ARW7G5Y1]